MSNSTESSDGSKRCVPLHRTQFSNCKTEIMVTCELRFAVDFVHLCLVNINSANLVSLVTYKVEAILMDELGCSPNIQS